MMANLETGIDIGEIFLDDRDLEILMYVFMPFVIYNLEPWVGLLSNMVL